MGIGRWWRWCCRVREKREEDLAVSQRLAHGPGKKKPGRGKKMHKRKEEKGNDSWLKVLEYAFSQEFYFRIA